MSQWYFKLVSLSARIHIRRNPHISIAQLGICGLNQLKLSTERLYLMLSTCMGILKFRFFSCPLDKKVIWLGVSGLTLNLMSWTCKGYTSTSEIKSFDSNVKQ